MRIFIRADANPEIGMGHVMRCLSIADALRAASHNNQITFLLADDSVTEVLQSRGFPVIVLGTDYRHMEAELFSWPGNHSDLGGMINLIIVDSYFVTAPYLTALHKKGNTVVYIDDLAVFPYPVDILINYNAYADERTYDRLYSQHSAVVGKEKKPLLLLGSRYAPLRSMFQNVDRKIQPQVVKNVLLSTGGADSLHLALNMVKRVLCSNNSSNNSPNNKSNEDEEEKREADFTWHILLGALNSDKDEIRKLTAQTALSAPSEGKERREISIILHENVTDMKSLICSYV